MRGRLLTVAMSAALVLAMVGALLVLITDSGAQCVGMPIDP